MNSKSLGDANNIEETGLDMEGLHLPFAFDHGVMFDLDDGAPLFFTDVLLVEDDSVTSSYIKQKMKKTAKGQTRVRSFSSAEQAADYIISLKDHDLPGPDLAIIDYKLKGSVDGLWLCKLIENRCPETRTILISGADEGDISEKMERYNVKPVFIQKPLGPSKLFNVIKSL